MNIFSVEKLFISLKKIEKKSDKRNVGWEQIDHGDFKAKLM